MSAGPPKEYVHGATSLELRSLRYLFAFLRRTRAIERAVKGMPGLVAYELRAKFFKLRFDTRSVWDDREALGRFMSLPEHEEAVRRFGQWSSEGSKTVHWTSSTAKLDWDEAERRLAEAPVIPVHR